MDNTLNQRITDVVSFLIFSKLALDKRDLAQKLGYNVSSFSQIINGRVPISDKFIDRLLEFAPDINEDWLIKGEGEMLKVPATMTFFKPTEEDRKAVGSGVDLSVIPTEIIEEIRNDVRTEIVGEHSTMQRCGDTRALSIEECNELCPARLPYVKGEIVQSRDVDIRHLIESEPQKLEFRTMRQMIGNPNYVQKVITAAMMPLFQPGDMLFVQFLPEDAKIISGAIYLVDTRVYGAMVRQVYLEDNDVYTLHSLNPDFKELHLRRDEIYSISLVVRSLRSDFNMPKVAPDTAEAYKRRDEQIEQLLSMHRDAMTEIRTQNERMAEERRRQDEERKAERDRLDKLIDRIMK